MEFKRFYSLENHYKEDFVEQVINSQEESYVLTEKIHGANLSFWCNNDEIKVASRNQWVDDDFYSAGDVIAEVKEKIKALKFNCEFVIWGELYGKGVQRDVHYCDDKRFIVFEVMINRSYLSVSDQKSFCLACDLNFVPVIYIGDHSVSGYLSAELDYESTVASENGFPGEMGEGFVLRPQGPMKFNKAGKALALKIKHGKFVEKSRTKNSSKVEQVTVSDNDKALYEEFESYATEARVKNVMSHGDYSKEDFGVICKNLHADIVAESGLNLLWDSEKRMSKLVGKLIAKTVGNFFREWEVFRSESM